MRSTAGRRAGVVLAAALSACAGGPSGGEGEALGPVRAWGLLRSPNPPECPALERRRGAMPRPPRRARRDRVSGWVRVELVVRQDGAVHGARVLDAEPAGLFEDAVLESVRRWRFAPYDTPRRTPRCASEQLFRFEWDRAPQAAVG